MGVTYAGQELQIHRIWKYVFPQDFPKIHIRRILRIVSFVKFWDSSYNRSHKMIHFQFKISSFPTINLICYGSIIMLSMLKLHDLWKWLLIFGVYLITWVFLRRWCYFCDISTRFENFYSFLREFHDGLCKEISKMKGQTSLGVLH